ncbi:MAG TPA: serine/threonine protein kinase, partial [Burkholderiaceae bacterium]|nr:serine/threonine protein kinase [Burkholderiaceae bacterium]
MAYLDLSPDDILSAVESLGLRCDGRLLTLNSYENRVYRVGLEAGPPVVPKFYRPGRWTDAQILEEHRYTAELAAHEIPVVAPIEAGGTTLHAHEGFRFAVYPRRGGRAPELDDPDTLAWLGRFIGRIHAVGATTRFEHRPTLDIASFGHEPRDWLLAHDAVPAELLPAWRTSVDLCLDAVAAAFQRVGPTRALRLHEFLFSRARSKPEEFGGLLKEMVRKELGEAWSEPDYSPPYNPWEQRLCL